MNKRRFSLRAAGFVLLLAVTAFVAYRLGPREPMAYGRTLTDWCIQFETGYLPLERDEAVQAVRSMGDEAVAVLVRRAIPGKPTFAQTKYETCWKKLPSWIQRWVPRPVVQEIDRACQMLMAIRPSFDAVWPMVASRVSSENEIRRQEAIWVLAQTGEGSERAAQYFVRGLQETNPISKHHAMQGLVNCGTNALIALPELVTALTNLSFQTRAIRALGNIGPDAVIATNALKTLSASSNTNLAETAKVALAKITLDEHLAEQLFVGLDDPNQFYQALRRLELLRTLGRSKLPILRELLQRKEFYWPSVISLLHDLGEPRDQVEALLLKRLAQPDPERWAHAAYLPAGLHPLPEPIYIEAARWITNARVQSQTRQIFVAWLGVNGDRATNALPALRMAAEDSDYMVRNAAKEALRRIEARLHR